MRARKGARTYTISEAAEVCGLSRKAVARRVERGSLRSVLRDGRRRIPHSELVRAGLLAGDGPAGAPLPDAGTLPAHRRGADGQSGETLEMALVDVIRELMDRFERQAGELARLRALPERAESVQLTTELGDIRARIAALEAPRPAEPPRRVPGRGQTRPQAGADLWLPGQPEGYRAGSPAGQSADSEVAELRSRLAHLEGERRARPLSGRARFLVEALFIGAVAFAAWVADLDPPVLVAVVAVAWLVAATVEAVSSWRGRD